MNSQTFGVEAVFHQYVSPKVNKKLTKFCVQVNLLAMFVVTLKKQNVPSHFLVVNRACLFAMDSLGYFVRSL